MWWTWKPHVKGELHYANVFPSLGWWSIRWSGVYCYTTMTASNSGNFVMYISCIYLDIELVHKSYQELFGLKLEPSLVSILLKSENQIHHMILSCSCSVFFCCTTLLFKRWISGVVIRLMAHSHWRKYLIHFPSHKLQDHLIFLIKPSYFSGTRWATAILAFLLLFIATYTPAYKSTPHTRWMRISKLLAS